MKPFAEVLKKERETYARGHMSQSKLAKRAGLDHSYVSRIERGQRNPPTRIIVGQLADALELTGRRRIRFFASAGYQPDISPPSPIAQGLQYLVDAERRVNINRPQDMQGSKQAVAMYGLALVVELAELIQELDWKAWKSRPNPPDKEKVALEFADLLAFVGVMTANVMAQTGLTIEDLAWAFEQKTEINIERANGQIDGYIPAGGISPKGVPE